MARAQHLPSGSHRPAPPQESAAATLPVSVAIIARNEASNLPRCLQSVRGWVAEMVVLLNDTTDASESLATDLGARVVRGPWLGYRDTKNSATDLCASPWVLSLDADEEVSEELRKQITEFFQGEHEQYDAAFFPRKVRFLGRWITHGEWYPDYSLRLFRREKGRWEGNLVHEKLALRGRKKKLSGDLHHYSFPTLTSHLNKIPTFADYFLQEQLQAGSRWSLTGTLARPAWRFFKGYILRRGFLDGFAGFYIAAATAFACFFRYSRLYEEQQGQTSTATDRPDPAGSPGRDRL